MVKTKSKPELKFGTLLGISVSVAVLFTFILAFIGGIYLGIYMAEDTQSYKVDMYDDLELELKEQNNQYDDLLESYRDLEYKLDNYDKCEVTFEQYETQVERHVSETVNMTITLLNAVHSDMSCVEHLSTEYEQNESFQLAYDSFLDSYYEMTDTLGVE